MRILVVDDDERSLRAAIESIEREIDDPSIVTARSRDEATSIVDAADSFDLVLCDLRLPPHSNSADVQEVHGLSVHAVCRQAMPGTPLIFLTGFDTSRRTRGLLARGGVASVYGVENHPMVDLIDKDDAPGLEDRLAELHAGFRRVAAVSVDGAVGLSESFRRAVALYAISSGHAEAVVISALGLSGASVGRVRLSGRGQTPALVFIKTDLTNVIELEYERYVRHVPNRLNPGFFAPTQSPLVAGLGGSSALVSTVADGTVSLFELLRDDPDSAARVVGRVHESMMPWTDTERAARAVSLSDLRAQRAPDPLINRFSEALDLVMVAESSWEGEMREVICHGDLHGENILVDSDSRPILIDFGDTGPGFSPADPITLELSVLFHKAGPARDAPIGGMLNWARWPDVEAFAGSSPLEPFVSATRRWASAIASRDQILAFAYAHCLRQLKYADTNKSLAIGIASACAKELGLRQ